MRVRKKGTGSSSHGYEWTEPGQVLDIPAQDAAELVAIAPHEFEVLPDLPDEPEDNGQDETDGDEQEQEEGDEQQPLVEPDPEPEPEAKPARGRRRVTEA